VAAPVPERPVDDARTPRVLVTDRPTLAALEARGLGLARVLGGGDGPTLDALWEHSAFGDIARVLREDVRRIGRSDARAGVGIRGHAHRLFDVRWLRSSGTRFELVAVASRMDRRPFHATACGETRLVYRLAYRTVVGGEAVASRLPMTVNVELRGDDEVEEGGCAAVARRWLVPDGLEGPALAERLTSAEGPLHASRLGRGRMAQVVVNLQTVRWPSGVRPAMGGHAEYVLRAFAWDGSGDRLVPRPLENTPDLARLRRDPRLREELEAWVREGQNLRAIDEGTAVLPERFLAERAVSVTPRGLARRANRPFRQLLDPDRFDDLDLSRYRRIGTPEALVRRLDDASCQGCHQSRSVAGFHALGDDAGDAPPGTALVTGTSPHLQGDVLRRERLVEALAVGHPPDYARPFAERSDDEGGAYGQACGLGDGGFAAWTCQPGLRCVALDAEAGGTNAVGACLPSTPGVGDPCQLGPVRPHADPHRDRVVDVQERACPPDMVCNVSAVGFPGGMCTGSCATPGPDGRCGPMALLAPFNACLARGEPFVRCLGHVRPAGLRACDADQPCRNDYVCMRTEGDGGVCMPPYFLMQLRVDGH
jgi:hypothetical protein